MTGVFRELKINYQGKDYRMTPSNRLLRQIEEEVCLLKVAQTIGSSPRVSEIAFIAAAFLREAGALVDEDEMYAALIVDLEDNGGVLYRSLTGAITAAISPTVDVAKNSPAPEAEK